MDNPKTKLFKTPLPAHDIVPNHGLHGISSEFLNGQWPGVNSNEKPIFAAPKQNQSGILWKKTIL
jgi:hypothetical protein